MCEANGQRRAAVARFGWHTRWAACCLLCSLCSSWLFLAGSPDGIVCSSKRTQLSKLSLPSSSEEDDGAASDPWTSSCSPKPRRGPGHYSTGWIFACGTNANSIERVARSVAFVTSSRHIQAAQLAARWPSAHAARNSPHHSPIVMKGALRLLLSPAALLLILLPPGSAQPALNLPQTAADNATAGQPKLVICIADWSPVPIAICTNATSTAPGAGALV